MSPHSFDLPHVIGHFWQKNHPQLLLLHEHRHDAACDASSAAPSGAATPWHARCL